jgi:hypothetical protein
MPATILNFTGDDAIEKGATFRQVLTWFDSLGAPVNLTGRTARMQVRKGMKSPLVVLDLTTENGGLVLGGSAGTITINISAAQTSAVAIAAGVHDLEVVGADGTVVRLFQGEAEFSPEVTRP